MKRALALSLLVVFSASVCEAKGIGNKQRFSPGDEIYSTTIQRSSPGCPDLTINESYIYVGHDGQKITLKRVVVNDCPSRNEMGRRYERDVQYPIKENAKKTKKRAHLGVVSADGTSKTILRATILPDDRLKVIYHPEDMGDDE